MVKMKWRVRDIAPIVVSFIVIGGFILVCSLLFIKIIPTESQQIAQVLFGGLVAMATTVVNYWMGSSSGSSAKDDTINQMHNDFHNRDDDNRPDIKISDTTVKTVSANVGNANVTTTTTQTTDMNNLLGGR
jgi:hypothetical protein